MTSAAIRGAQCYSSAGLLSTPLHHNSPPSQCLQYYYFGGGTTGGGCAAAAAGGGLGGASGRWCGDCYLSMASILNWFGLGWHE